MATVKLHADVASDKVYTHYTCRKGNWIREDEKDLLYCS